MGREEDQLQLPTFQGQHPISLARRRLDHCMVSCEAGGTIQATWWTSGGRGRWRAPGTANLRPLPGTVVRRPVAWGPLCDSISARPRACRTSSSTDLAASLRDAQRPLSHTARPFLPARRPERIKDGRRILDPREHRQPPGLVRQRLGWRGRIARHQPPDGLDRTNSNRQEEEARASLRPLPEQEGQVRWVGEARPSVHALPNLELVVAAGQGRPCTYVSKSNKRKNRPRPTTKAELGQSSLPPMREDQSSAAREVTDVDKAGANSHEMLEFRPHVQLSGTNDSPDSPSNLPSASKPSRVWMGKSSAFASVGDAFRIAAANGIAKPPNPRSELAGEHRQGFGFQPTWEMEEYSDIINDMNFWPADDLALGLVDLYFNTCNLTFPLFREAEFRKRLRRKDYQADQGFANVCLMMFAVSASHGSFDSRTFAPNFSTDPFALPSHGRHSAGWTYYYQATRRPRRHTKAAEASDLQFAALTCMFLSHSSNPLVCWSIIGEGVTHAYEMGAHRGGLGQDAVENDLLRRGFWSLFVLDSQLSAGLGRAPHIAPSTFDAPLPVQIATNAREDLTAFYYCIKLSHLVRTTTSSLYGIDSHTKSKNWVVQQMAALNAEVDTITSSLPESLRWTPSQPDANLAHKTVTVQLLIQQTLILINRSALPNWRTPKAPPISSISFDIAVAAAQKGALVYLDYVMSGKGLPPFLITCQDSAATLASALFGGRAAGVVVNEKALLKSLQDCWRAMARSGEFWVTTAPAIGWIYALLEMLNAVPKNPHSSETNPSSSNGALGLHPSQSHDPFHPTPMSRPSVHVSTDASQARPDQFDYSALYHQFSLEGFGFGMGTDEGFAFDFELGAEGAGGIS